MKMRFAVVGHGFMGPRHVAMLNRFEETECVAVCDTDPLRLEGLPEDIRRYTSMDELMNDGGFDAVVIATPNKYHKEQVIQAARAGKHVICEKPVAMSVADLDEMLAVAKESNVILTAHQQRRFDRDYQTIKTVYEQNSLGDVYLIKSSLYGYNGNMHDWHVWRSEGGGMLFDWGVHLVDQMLYMIDNPLKSVYADVRNVINFEVDDYFKIILRFENRVTAEIELGTYMLSDKEGWFPRHWYMCGNQGSMYVDQFVPEGKIVRTSKLLTDVTNEAGQYCGPTRSFGQPDEGTILTEALPSVCTVPEEYYENFLRAVKGEEKILVTPQDMRRVLAIIEAARESAETMQSIPFE